MTTATDAALAQLSLNAYSNTPVTLPAGFSPATLPLTLGAGQSFVGGLYQSDNSAALLAEGAVDGQESLVIAFRGSDDQQDSFNDLQNINADYTDFTTLIQAVDQAAASGRYDQIVVTGHSLGGSLAQQFMAAHPEQAGVTYDAVTFGSPGALLPPGVDARITNFVVADDPAVALGAHRAEIGEVLRSDPALANLAADKAAEELPGLTEAQALAAINSLTVNYENRGDIMLLPGKTADLSPQAGIAGLARLDTAQHAPELYASSVTAAAASPEPELIVPETGTTDPQLLALRSIYDSDGGDPQVFRSLIDGWRQDVQAEANDVFTGVRDDLAAIGRDLNLI
ncbi:alpha/beta fold hydrolase [Belnapia sp. T18]|uniref:Alpha/beta fold hydrolase n=1 Tax=Belnapia arida TaxID=2804533 RepID=A0ABS1U5D4_9PROT|nr:alpha/beta fold hydrolase [Belnapia arida]MBL6079891.1 alpha/beta fold hydrolase [Belnapia arida]